MNRNSLRRAAPSAALVALAMTMSACSASNEDTTSTPSSGDLSGTLAAAGSSAQEAAQGAWIAGIQTANPGVTINYDPVGSGGGREQFIAGGTAFAGSDAYMSDEEIAMAKDTCSGDVVEIPAYVSPIAVIYNLPGVDTLNLSPENIGAIFEGSITTWNDPAIAADNADVELPDTTITPVHRSDDSGTTENFTNYMEATSGDAWSGGTVEAWPIKGGEGADGTSGVVAAVTSGEGAVGYADASQAGDLGVAKVGVGSEFTELSPEAAAAVVDASTQVEGRPEADLAYDLSRDTTESGVYPIVLLSYEIACTTYDDPNTGAVVKAYFEYIISEEGQQAAADAAGSAPISDTLRQQAETAVAAIETS